MHERIHRHRKRRRVALDDHAQGIADEEDIHAFAVQQPRERGVVARQGGKLLTPRVAVAECMKGQSFPVSHRRMVTQDSSAG